MGVERAGGHIERSKKEKENLQRSSRCRYIEKEVSWKSLEKESCLESCLERVRRLEKVERS